MAIITIIQMVSTFKDSSTDSEARTTSETASTADSTLTLLRELLGHVTIYYN